jgi:hypothetical protein
MPVVFAGHACGHGCLLARLAVCGPIAIIALTRGPRMPLSSKLVL